MAAGASPEDEELADRLRQIFSEYASDQQWAHDGPTGCALIWGLASLVPPLVVLAVVL